MKNVLQNVWKGILNTFNFRGTLSFEEYRHYTRFLILVFIGWNLLFGILVGFMKDRFPFEMNFSLNDLFKFLHFSFYILVAFSYFSALIRRLHDVGKNTSYVLVFFALPYGPYHLSKMLSLKTGEALDPSFSKKFKVRNYFYFLILVLILFYLKR